MQFFQSFLLVVSTLLYLIIAGYAVSHVRTRGAASLLVLLAAAIIWSGGSFMELYVSTLSQKLLWRNVQQIGVFTVPVATLYFTMAYTQWTGIRKWVIPATLIPLATVILILTDGSHHIMRTGCALVQSGLFGQTLVVESTILGSVLVSVNFTLPIISMGVLVAFRAKVSDRLKRQTDMIIGSFLYVFAVSFLKMSVLEPMGVYVFISVLYIPGALMLFHSLFRYDFFNLSPIARDKVFDVVEQGILVTGRTGAVVDANGCAHRLLRTCLHVEADPVGADIRELFDYHPLLHEFMSGDAEGHGQAQICRGENCHYLGLDFYPLKTRAGALMGCVLIFNDITPLKLRELSLQEKAEKDPLTGLLNRSGFESAFEEEIRPIYAEGLPVSVFMIDLDGLKQINDTRGHESGDRILRHFAKVITDSLREQDVIARMGGDEFAVVLPGIDQEEAAPIADRIRRNVAVTRVELEEDMWAAYTVSIGIADSRDPRKSLPEMLREADEALYEAKNRSRNRVVLYHDFSDSPPAETESE